VKCEVLAEVLLKIQIF